MKAIFSHVGMLEAFICFLGITLYWVLMYSNEKDDADVNGQKFPFKVWFKTWISQKNDNILAHLVVSYFFLFLGVDNLQAWMGDQLSLPAGLDEIGAAGMIGYSGTFIAAGLKKLQKMVH